MVLSGWPISCISPALNCLWAPRLNITNCTRGNAHAIARFCLTQDLRATHRLEKFAAFDQVCAIKLHSCLLSECQCCLHLPASCIGHLDAFQCRTHPNASMLFAFVVQFPYTHHLECGAYLVKREQQQ